MEKASVTAARERNRERMLNARSCSVALDGRRKMGEGLGSKFREFDTPSHLATKNTTKESNVSDPHKC